MEAPTTCHPIQVPEYCNWNTGSGQPGLPVASDCRSHYSHNEESHHPHDLQVPLPDLPLYRKDVMETGGVWSGPFVRPGPHAPLHLPSQLPSQAPYTAWAGALSALAVMTRHLDDNSQHKPERGQGTMHGDPQESDRKNRTHDYNLESAPKLMNQTITLGS
jgi:hypothetical protein